MQKLIFKTIFTLIFIYGAQHVAAQSNGEELTKQVEVVKEYNPESVEVFKIESFPVTEKSTNKPSIFEYNISPIPYTSAKGAINPIAPAKMSGLPSDEGNYGYIKAGFGNYSTPYGELFLNSKPKDNSKFLFGLYAKHLSSSGDIDLIDGPKVESNYSYNNANVFGKYLGDKIYARLSLDFDRDRIDYYGWANSLHEALLPSIGATSSDVLNTNKNIFTSYGASFAIGNNSLQEQSRIGYDVDLGFHIMDFLSGQTEMHTRVMTDLNYKVDNFIVGTKLGIENADMKNILGNSLSGTSPDFKNNKSTIYFSPYLTMQKGAFDIHLGLYTALNFGSSNIDTSYISDVGYSDVFIAPDIRMVWRACESVTLDARLSGDQTFGYMGGIVKNMPYVDPSQIFYAPNTGRYFAEIGGDIDLTSKLEAKIKLNYSIYTDKAQYVYGVSPNTLTHLRTFSLENDDFNNFQTSLQLNYKLSRALQITGGIQYLASSGDVFDKDAYNPDLSFVLSGRYSKNGIYVSPQFRFIKLGTVYANDYSTIKELDTDNIMDLSIEGGYEFAKNISFFCRLNNLLFQDYEFWHGYTAQSFNGLIGIAYLF